MAPPKTIPAIKTAFINEQVRILSQPLETPMGVESQTTIPRKNIDQAVKECKAYRHHTKSVYPSLAVADVAHQIDYLYWSLGQPNVINGQDAPLRKTDDLTDDRNIARLPDDLSQSEAYQRAATGLRDAAERRQTAQQKLDKYHRLQRELAILKDPQKSVQPQLASREGTLAQELGKSRALATKLAGKLAGSVSGRAAGHELHDQELSKASLSIVDEDQRVREALRHTG